MSCWLISKAEYMKAAGLFCGQKYPYGFEELKIEAKKNFEMLYRYNAIQYELRYRHDNPPKAFSEYYDKQEYNKEFEEYFKAAKGMTPQEVLRVIKRFLYSVLYQLDEANQKIWYLGLGIYYWAIRELGTEDMEDLPWARIPELNELKKITTNK